MIDSRLIQEFRDQVIRNFRPSKIVLFGSYAYGKPGYDSDVDILVIMPFYGKSARKSAEILQTTDPPFPIDLIVRTPEQINDRIMKGDFFLREIMEKGKVLYESSNA